MQKYPDTAEGAIQCLEADSTYNLQNATARPDPSVRGVWLVMFRGHKVIVYLSGYPDPWGQIRETNDFEEVE